MSTSSPSVSSRSLTQKLTVLVWALAPVLVVFLRGALRLTYFAWTHLSSASLQPIHIVALITWVAFSLYAEAYRGFQLRYCPRVLSRAMYLAHHGRWSDIALGPIFAMGLVRARKGRLIASWSVSLGVVGLIAIVTRLPTFWRAIVDAGVGLALGWGFVCFIWGLIRHGLHDPPRSSVDLPPNG